MIRQLGGTSDVGETPSTAKRIVDRAHEISDAEARRAYLDQACGTDAELRQCVDKLLHAFDENSPCPDRSAATLDTGNVEPGRWFTPHAPPIPPLEIVGNCIGSYKLFQQIGEGGMGVVFMAEQQEPVRRMVALKIIKAGLDSAQVIARFEAERQALALMDHPNIAKVLDADTTSAGRPYFVMELVKGIPITKYCDEQRLTLRQRLEVFVPVCQAIQHAHQKGIIHRDIKPSNVLIAAYDGKPVPKVIDFGVAKAMGQKLTDRTLFTGFGGILGTLEYMSPEQAEFNALDIDTRSDVYSLGVLLFELLTGTTPLMRHRLKDASLTDVLRLIREEEAPRPSTRLSATKESLASVSAQRQTDPAALVKALRGEVDWIVMKALEKDRARRYESANGLARDIQRYLADEPLEAGPPSATYRLRKLAWKHRRSLATAGTLLLLLVVGVVVSTCLAVWAMRAQTQAQTAEQNALGERNRALAAEADAKEQRDKALAAEKVRAQSEEDAKAVLGFFQDKVLSAGRPQGQDGGLGNKVTLRKAVDAAEPEIVKAFADRPLVEASIRDTLGTTYLYLGERASAIQQYERALTLRESHLGSAHSDTLTSRNNLANAYHAAARIAEALPLLEQNLKQMEASFGPDHANTLRCRSNLAVAYDSVGRIDEAIRLQEQILKQQETKLGLDHPDTLGSRNNLAAAYRAAGRTVEAIRLHEQTLARYEATLGPEHPNTLLCRNNLAAMYHSAGRMVEAIRLHEKNLKLREDKLGPDHPDTIFSVANLGISYRDAGRSQDAIAKLEEALERGRKHSGALPASLTWVLAALVETYSDAGQFAKAEPLCRTLVEETRKRLGSEHATTAEQQSMLGHILLRQHKYSDAELVLRDCLKVREANQPDAWTTFSVRSQLGEALMGQKKYGDAESLLLSGYQGMKKRQQTISPQGKPRLTEALDRLVHLYQATGNKVEADKWRKELAEAKKSFPKETNP